MEDYGFVQRMKRLGKTTCLPLTVTTWARRYRGRIAKTAAIWGSIFLTLQSRRAAIAKR
jgi:hypothetical protein